MSSGIAKNGLPMQCAPMLGACLHGGLAIPPNPMKPNLLCCIYLTVLE